MKEAIEIGGNSRPSVAPRKSVS